MNPLLQAFGGLGLFLFGMAAMTSGLRKLAGDRLRLWLGASTRSPLSGAFTGATVTAIIQSSSATTVAAVGFVSAGLLTFTQSLGIIFGANIGTTMTGWMVALLGFKFQLADAALPLLFVASLAYLIKSHRMLRGAGKALAGFSLIFIGIGFLQSGLAAFQGAIDLSSWSAYALSGRLLLVGLGVALTLITQSSSATVAASLTALNASLLDLPQAVAVIIGADIGTTATAALATIGGNTASRRTGFAHVIYNLMTGLGAFLLLPLYLHLMDVFFAATVSGSPESVAILFHSIFNILGVLVVLPFTASFARFIERLIPDETEPLNAAFNPKLLGDPHTALDALEVGARQTASSTLGAASAGLENAANDEPVTPSRLSTLQSAVEAGRDFALRVSQGDMDEPDLEASRIFASLHLLDHTDRLVERLRDTRRQRAVKSHPALAQKAAELAGLLAQLARVIQEPGAYSPSESIRALAGEMESDKGGFRHQVIEAAAANAMTASQLDETLDTHRWLRRVARHAERIAFYARPGSTNR